MNGFPMRALIAPLAFALSFAGAAGAADAVHYRVRTEAADDRLAALAVTMTVPARVGESLTLDLPSLVVAERAASRLEVDGAQVQGAGGDGQPADRLRLRATAATVTLRYRLPADGSDSLLADQDNPQRTPAVRNAWFALKGENALVVPEGRERSAATLDLEGIPAGWMATTSLSGPATVADVADSLMIGGRHYGLLQRNVGGATLRLAYPSGLEQSAADLLDASARVLQAQWRFWRAPAQPFFIGLVQMKNDSDYGGRGLHGGFALFMGDKVARSEWLHLIAHENLHTWISRRIGGFPQRDDDLEAWLNEGFTEAYTARILLESGLWTPAQFVADWNRALVRFGASPARAEPNARILADRFRDADIQWLPYDRGRVLAVLWDRQLRRATHGRVGLDDVLRAQVLQAARNSARGQVASADVLLPVMVRRMTGVDLSGELARHVDRGEWPVLPEDSFGPCVRVVQVTRPAFDHGFDFAATLGAGGRLTGLEPGGPAERAGLREGDRLHIDEVYGNDSTVTLDYGVDNADGTRRRVRYRPEGSRSVTIQQLEPVSASTAGRRCVQGMLTP